MVALKDLTKSEVEGIVDAVLGKGTLDKRVAGNPLYSEDLTSAGRSVGALQDPDISRVFKGAVVPLMTGDNAQGHMNGFSMRQSFGIAVTRAIKGDFDRLEKFVSNVAEPESAQQARAELLLEKLRNRSKGMTPPV